MVNAGLTKLSKEIVPVEFVGQNASYQLLQQPKKPAYPRGDEARYSDDFLARINGLYSLDELLGTHKEGIKVGNWTDLNHFTMGSSLENSEGEDILNAILYNSAHAGLWQPRIIDVSTLTDTHIKSAEEYLGAVKRISPTYHKGMIDGGVISGISNAQRGGFVHLTKLENRVIVLPSQAFIEYVAQQR